MKSKLVNYFIIGTFVSLYLLVSVISTIHVIDFFEMSNPRWMAITLAIGFELGAAASLAALITLDKMNKTLVWALFIVITAMQIQGNMFFAFKHLADFSSWSELFNLIEEELLYQKRIIAAVSGAILPLVALGFIKSLVDYIKPEGDIKEEDVKEIKEKVFEHPDWNGVDEHWNGDDELFDDELDFINDDFNDSGSWDYDDIADKSETHFNNQPQDEKWNDEYSSNMHYEFEEDPIKYQDINSTKNELEEWDDTLLDGLEDDYEWDEDHAHDMVLNDMVDDFDGNDFDAIGEELEAGNFTEPNFTEDDATDIEVNPPKEPVKDVDASYKFGKNLYNTMMSKINTDHLPKPSTEETTKAYNNLGLINKKR